MTSQINMKVPAELKKEAEQLAKKMGLSLSSVLRLFLTQFVHTKQLNISLNEDDTPADLTGKRMEEEMIAAGYDSKYAKQNGEDYDRMLQAKKDGTLIRL